MLYACSSSSFGGDGQVLHQVVLPPLHTMPVLGALAIVLVAGFFGVAAVAGGRQDTSCCFNAR